MELEFKPHYEANIEIITILLVGSTGSGKSTLANVLSGSEDYDTSHRSVSSTKDTNSRNYAINGKIYRIVDTVGIGDSRMPPKEVANKLAVAAEAIKYGINQILFVASGKFTDVEIEAFETLQEVVFDKSVFDYTTIVRTKFPDFEDDVECEKDYQDTTCVDDKLTQLVKSCQAVIHVDNPPITKRTKQVAEEIREVSRKKILNYLDTCTNVYIPEKLQETMNEKVGDYMTNKEKLQQKVSDLEEKVRKLQEGRCIIS
nr:11100_t:CDS:2 [Entrophospora candida]